MPKSVYIGLGANLGEPVDNLRRAAVLLEEMSEGPLVCSSIWVSEPEGFTHAVQDFCNAVVRMTWEGEADALLGQLLSIEQQLGRARHASDEGYSSRLIDLDIIDFGGLIWDTPALRLPHPRAHLRRFVLIPLHELAPDYRFPDRRETLAELIAKAPANPLRRAGSLAP